MVPVWIRPWVLTALLCYAVFGFYWYLFVGYADGWHNQPKQHLATKLAEPVDWSELKTAAAGEDVLLSVASTGRDGEVEACTREGRCPDACQAGGRVATGDARPVLNCLLSTPEADPSDPEQQVERMLRQRDPLGLSYLLRSTDGRLAVVARLQGDVKNLQCGPNGVCYLIAELPGIANRTVFVSNDFGHHWRVAARNVLEKAYVPKIIGIDDQRVWVDGFQTIYLSEDRGQHWRILATDDRLREYDASVVGKESHSDRTSDRFRWHLDDAGQLYAFTGDRYSTVSGVGIYRLNARTGEILSAARRDGSLTRIENGPGGQLFGLYRSPEPTRHTLYRLHQGQWSPVLTAGNARLGSLYASENALIVEKGRGDGRHMLLSRDGGEHWQAMDDIYIEGRMSIDPAGVGWLRMGYRNSEGYYGYRWVRP
ncbi:beta propeller repeat protein [Marinobacter oulmenensis]|uniref:Exo-alpha-sialidase n=1 Tax=Marinobacter oulmenensis TaxID=643747 RepID=A0A840UIY7_9GAMM|nr:hypothetical protein [Marinobacter oulmenensis]MBB5320738.1 hypothetical protein [Marinobacter oulmenensis]